MKRIVLRGGPGDGREIEGPGRWPVQYADEKPGTVVYVRTGEIDEQGREVFEISAEDSAGETSTPAPR